MIPLLLAMPFGPMLALEARRPAGRGAAARRRDGRVRSPRCFVAIVAGRRASVAARRSASALGDLADRRRAGRSRRADRSSSVRRSATSLSRLAGLPRSALGTVVAHAGIGVTVLGIVAASAYSDRAIVALQARRGVRHRRLHAALPGRRAVDRAELPRGDGSLFVVSRRRRGVSANSRRRSASTVAREMATTEAAIRTTGFSQLYVTLGDRNDERRDQRSARCYKPLVTLIWIGAVVMALGGALSLSDRRLRVGAPAARQRRGSRRRHDGRRFSSLLRSRSRRRRLAVQPDEQLADPALEARARDISAGLRCLVCQNQSIDDSDAPLARDLRILVRAAAGGRGQRRRGPRLSSSRAMASSCCSSRRSISRRFCSG